jgi:ketosteroid isomerase-like protein
VLQLPSVRDPNDTISQLWKVGTLLTSDDRWEISDLLSRYSIAVDSRNLALLDEVFTEDVQCVFQTGSGNGRDAVRDFMWSVLKHLTATQHNITSSVVTASGDEAEGTSYLVVQHLRTGAEGGETFAMGGTYYDRFRRENGAWRIYRRELIGSWRSGNPDVMIRT